MARLAPGAGRARAGARQGDRQAGGGDRADGALRRALLGEGDARPGRRRIAPRSSRSWRPGASRASPKDTRELGFQFKKPERSGRVIFELEDGRLEVGDPAAPRTLLHDAELWLERGEHVSLVGTNGTGKTTLIKALAGQAPFAEGRLRTGHNVTVGYLSQHGEELEFGGARTVLEAAVKRTGLTPNEARALLGRFLFSGEEVEKPLDGLSGGERKRLGLAILVTGGANVLVLDEPTNHLDLESREALEDALQAFPGLAAARHARSRAARRRRHAHDRGRGLHAALVRRRLGGVRPRARGAQGARARQRPAATAARGRAADGAPRTRGVPTDGRRRRPARPAKARPKGPSKNRQKEQARLEAAIERAETEFAAVEEELADPAAWATAYESAKSQARHTAAKRAVEDAYAELEAFEARGAESAQA